MDTPRGRVVAVAPGRVTVSVDLTNACARCASGKGCGAGLLSGSRQSRHIDARVMPGTALKPGDEVGLTLAPSHLLRAAVFAYGLPLAGVITALGAAWILNQALSDALAVLLAIAGASGGAIVGRYYLGRDACLQRLTPSVTEHRAARSNL